MDYKIEKSDGTSEDNRFGLDQRTTAEKLEDIAKVAKFHSIRSGCLALALSVTNLCSFVTVGTQKYFGYSKEQTAFVNTVGSNLAGTNPIDDAMYSLGYELGFRYFYGEKNLLALGESQCKKIRENVMERD